MSWTDYMTVHNVLLSGNEAIALGARKAGVSIGVGYPGTPSTETLEKLATFNDIYSEWAPNEKVALEVAAGASFAGSRVLVAMKHVGLNVAADPLFTLAYTGVNGGLVILVADDPGMHSSQNEQDSHNYAPFAGVPVLDPADPREAYEMAQIAFEISERYNTVVLIRTTVRVAHTKELVSVDDSYAPEFFEMKRDPTKWVMMPGFARKARLVRDAKLEDLRDAADSLSTSSGLLNQVEIRDKRIGVVCAGVVYHYVREAGEELSICKLGMTYPLPEDMLRAFAASVDEVVVAEEADDFLLRSLKALGIPCRGLDVARVGELSPERVREGLGLESIAEETSAHDVVNRPPLLCAGCPHRPVFHALKKVGAVVAGDIGCYTLGAVPPLNGIDTCVCMGASIPMAHGIEISQAAASRAAVKAEAKLVASGGEMSTLPKSRKRPVVAIIGDSTFAHSGITGVINTVYNGGAGTVCILDNRITAMTGHQGNPVNGTTLQKRMNRELDLEPLLKACGVERVRTVDPTNLQDTIDALKEETSAEEYSVIIFKSPCILLTRSWPTPFEVDVDACRSCKLCTAIGCPALEFNEETALAFIDKDGCRGCGLCAQVCPFDAIHRATEEGSA